MNILILESDSFLSGEMQEFCDALLSMKHAVTVICRCYSMLPEIAVHIKSTSIDAIAFMTTFVFHKKFTGLFEVAKHLTRPVQLWDLNGKYLNDSIGKYIPKQFQSLFVVKQFNPLFVISGDLLPEEI